MHRLRHHRLFDTGHAARIACAAAALIVALAGAGAQTPPTPAQPQPDVTAPPSPAPNPGPQGSGGFIEAFGHWIGSSMSDWNSGVKGAADAAGSAAKGAADTATNVTRDTADAVARIPGTRVIAERATCPTAPNGAPDCRAAAESICKAHGFASGSSIDFQTAEKCPPIALNRPNGDPPPACVLESYVTRALCQ
jgi:hypothetical protein